MDVILFEDSCSPHAASVRQFLPDSATALVLRTEALEDVAHPTIAEYLVGLARRHNLLGSWQSTVLSHQEFFESLKVVCARLNQEEFGDFSVPTSEVISAQVDYAAGEDSRQAIAYRAFLKECNAIDQFGLLRILQQNKGVLQDSLVGPVIVEGPLRTSWHKAAVEFLAENRSIRRVQVELPVDEAVSQITEDQVHLEEVDVLVPKDTSAPRQSQSLAYTLTILKSFLSLLVNNRDEVAISCALACPLVSLSHEAFTIVKRAASEARSPIYQFVQSYIMKKKLGGRGYAPPPNCPVKAFAKEMTAFIELMDKLQTFVEEHKPSVALAKVTGCVLARLSKAIQQEAFRTSMVEKAKDIVKVLCDRLAQNPSEDSAIAPGMIGREAVHLVRRLSDTLASLGYHQKAAKILCSPFSAATPSKTPVGAQTLFRLFQSPEDTKDEECVALNERAPLPATPLAKPTMAFSVRFEPEPPKRFTDDLDLTSTPATNREEVEAPVQEQPAKPVSSGRLVVRGDVNSTPNLKTSTKRKETLKVSALTKRRKLVSADDPENQVPGSEPVKKGGKVAVKAKNPKKAIPANQRTLGSFFTKL